MRPYIQTQFWRPARNRAQALREGLLIDLSGHPQVREYFTFPVAVSAALWRVVISAADAEQETYPYPKAVEALFQAAIDNFVALDRGIVYFSYMPDPREKCRSYPCKILGIVDDDGNPVLTLLLIEEEYAKMVAPNVTARPGAQ